MPTVFDHALCANEVYQRIPGEAVGWRAGETRFQFSDGELQAAVFRKNGEAIVAFKGTDPLFGPDGRADAKLTVCMNSSYFWKAERFVRLWGKNATLTGHSLGGAIAQVVGHRMNIPFVTFNAPGVALWPTFSTGRIDRNLSQLNPVAGAVRAVGALAGVVRHPYQAKRDFLAFRNRSHGLNYRLSGDLISEVGIHRGKVITLSSKSYGWNPMKHHSMENLMFEIAESGQGNLYFGNG